MEIKKTIKNAAKKVVRLTEEKEIYPVPKPTNVDKILEGKIALITGGSGGIGSAMAKAFVNAGCKVIICGTNEVKLQECIKRINSKDVLPLVLNVLDIDSMPGKIQSALTMFPDHKIDILVNAAGVIAHSSFDQMTEKEYDSVMDVNTKGTFFMSQVVSKYMIENEIKGHILNVTSASALRPAWSPYQMSKWAVRGFTLGLADTLLPYGIIVNAIAPGPTVTPMLNKNEGDSIAKPEQPSGRYAMPSEIASMATFLVSDMGNLIVGDTVYMTGGSGVLDTRN